jgi:hypothetical protein
MRKRVAVLAIEGLCIPEVYTGRSSVRLPERGIFLRSLAEHEWVYLSVSPRIYTLDDFWEESLTLRSSLQELAEGLGG